jgi:undecaprenyl-diphosphatase
MVFVTLMVGFAIERPAYFLLKNSFKRNRPPNIIPGFESVITASDEFSFPSGHTSGVFLVVTALALLIPVGVFGFYLYVWAVAVALSRIVLGVHFPMDTVAGALLGSSIAWGAIQIVDVVL